VNDYKQTLLQFITTRLQRGQTWETILDIMNPDGSIAPVVAQTRYKEPVLTSPVNSTSPRVPASSPFPIETTFNQSRFGELPSAATNSGSAPDLMIPSAYDSYNFDIQGPRTGETQTSPYAPSPNSLHNAFSAQLTPYYGHNETPTTSSVDLRLADQQNPLLDQYSHTAFNSFPPIPSEPNMMPVSINNSGVDNNFLFENTLSDLLVPFFLPDGETRPRY